MVRALLLIAAMLMLIAPFARAQFIEDQVPVQARGLDVQEKPGALLPLDARLVRADGKAVTLGDYLKPHDQGGKPTILALVYFRCPVVCSAVLDKLGECLDKLDYTVGDEFQTLVISFDERETTEDAKKAKEMHLLAYDREVTDSVRAGYEFFTGPPDSIRVIAETVGFQFRRLANGEYSHPVVLFVLTPDGKVSRYFYGFEYPPRDMKLALIEASEGKVAASIGDRLLAFCFMYDPSLGRYTLQVMRVMQLGGLLSMACVFGAVGVLLFSERRKRRRLREAGAAAPSRSQSSPATARAIPGGAA